MVDYDLNELLRLMPEMDASDLHLRVGQHPILRVHGDLIRMEEYEPLNADDTKNLAYSMMGETRRERFEEQRVLDMAYELEGVARFRVNVFYQQGQVSAALRMIPIEIQTIDELNLPAVLKDLAMLPRGLVLVTGPTGSGKSTTLAAMIDYINDNRREHVVTMEDPIEFVHQDKNSVIEQREVEQDTESFSAALTHVLRATPDVILVGEMRDLDTIQHAIRAAETGHLVFSTLHTTDAMQTVDRIIDVFPPDQQEQVRTQLSVTLQGVICQALLRRKNEEGRIPSFEIMRGTPAIHAAVREGKTHMIYNMILGGADEGMIVLDQYLANIVRNDSVTYEEALSKSSYPDDFERRCGEYAKPVSEDEVIVAGQPEGPPEEPAGGYVHGEGLEGQQ